MRGRSVAANVGIVLLSIKEASCAGCQQYTEKGVTWQRKRRHFATSVVVNATLVVQAVHMRQGRVLEGLSVGKRIPCVRYARRCVKGGVGVSARRRCAQGSIVEGGARRKVECFVTASAVVVGALMSCRNVRMKEAHVRMLRAKI